MRPSRWLPLVLALTLPTETMQLLGCSSGDGHPPPLSDVGSAAGAIIVVIP